ncbi:hypothetical protein C6Y14_21605 [Streptomyces dioscori]|uniref:Uncharacterized protein n=1 Tax=Streptomyces dioscori TaxID=2109333 RepID=A0A2P8Q551_9ACTN|nr:hypothetical protein [Streptomyces dioscori]PSM41370.1 hypothetical protein C6Y14_21605 [Streptomyces dioscori]
MRAVRRLVAHEVRLLASIVRWVARRPDGVGPGSGSGRGRAFGYARGQGAMMFGFGFVCVLESACMAVLLRNHPAVHRVVLALDVYTLLLVVGMHAASVTRPHVLGDTVLRVRRAAQVDLRVPLSAIASVRRELVTTHERSEGRLDLAVAAQTTVTLELDTPVRHFSFLGRPRDVRLIRFHADESDALVRAIREAVQPPPVQPAPLTPERTAPSPSPDRPG